MPFLGRTPTQLVDPEVDINGGAIDGVTIGATSASPATVTTFTSTGIDDNASSTTITIDSSENVGIGTTSPLNVANYTSLQLDGTTGGILSLSDDGTEYGRLLAFADNCIVTQPSATGNIHFRVGGTNAATERMRMVSSGN